MADVLAVPRLFIYWVKASLGRTILGGVPILTLSI